MSCLKKQALLSMPFFVVVFTGLFLIEYMETDPWDTIS